MITSKNDGTHLITAHLLLESLEVLPKAVLREKNPHIHYSATTFAGLSPL
jgi:hypothetical protein